MIVYAIEAMRASKSVTRYIVDTEDEEIAQIASTWGAEVPYIRPRELARDDTPHVPVLKNALETLRRQENYTPDVVVLVQPTSPLVEAKDIDAAVECLFRENADSVEAVFELPGIFHPYKIRQIDEKGNTSFFMPRERAQAMATGKWPRFYAIGTIYCFRPANVQEEGKIQGAKNKSIIIDRSTAVDIDEPYDLEIAEFLLKKRSIE
jgi:CMP-N,N'-diacetyllegionaminic acid synthase